MDPALVAACLAVGDDDFPDEVFWRRVCRIRHGMGRAGFRTWPESPMVPVMRPQAVAGASIQPAG